MSKNKKCIIEILISAILLIIAVFLKETNQYISLTIFILAYLIVGWRVIRKAFKNILHGQWMDENFLMTISTIGAFFIKEYPEAVGVMIFYQIGELFQNYAVNKSRKSIQELMNIRPDYANVERNGNIETVDPDEVEIGEIIQVKPGEKVPLDGIVISGESMLDTASLTGESVPRSIKQNDEILSGCVNISGLLRIKVTTKFENSTISKILDLIENATSKKSKSENFITKFAKYYTPIVVILAVCLCILLPIITSIPFMEALERALTFLVISCPCALVISVPLSFFGGIGGAAKQGILVKGSNYLENLSKVDTIILDKTGTITKGVFEVQKICTNGIIENELLELTAYAEYNSNHPIAISLKEKYGKDIDTSKIDKVEEISGQGVVAIIDGKKVLVGNIKLMHENKIECSESKDIGTIIYVAVKNEYKGYIVIADEIKAEAKTSIEEMKKTGIKNIVMLTGDKGDIAENIGNAVGIDKIHSELLPTDKFNKIEEILKKQEENKKVAFVGDGINDAPSLARADIGIAMGGVGSDAAIEAADIILMTDELSKIATSIKISKKTLKIVKQNIVFAIGVKVAVLVLGALGISTMWEAVFADVGVAVIAILNAMRAMRC